MAGAPALQPFDRHPANVGALEQAGADLADQAAKSIDASRLTFLAFLPATHNWDGIAAAELRAAPRPVRDKAFEISDSLAWASVAIRYWASQVTAFNHQVERIAADFLTAQANIFGTTQPDGTPVPLDTMLEAAQAVKAEAEREWHDAYDTHIFAGARRASGMLRDGPTAGHVAAARWVGLVPPGQPWNPLDQMWDSFKGNFLPPGKDYGPLGPLPWWGGRAFAGAGAAATAAHSRGGIPWATDRTWRVFSKPSIHPEWRRLVDRAARASKLGGNATAFLGSLSQRLHDGRSGQSAAAGAAAETATVAGCARVGASAGVTFTPPHPAAKAAGAIAGGIGGAVVCSPVAKKAGDLVGDAVDKVGGAVDDIKKLGRLHP
jgi:hypothetical protein